MFNLSFLNSYFLYGLLLASAPVIIHLVNRKKAVSLKFPTIRFIIESNKRVAKKFRLRQIILLILRTLAILAIIFLFARPLVRSEESELDYATLSRGTVIIVDNSSSMLFRDREGSFFKAAVSSAESIIIGQKGIDSAALLTTCDDSDDTVKKLSFNKADLLTALKEVKARYTKPKTRDVFVEAVEILKPSTAAVKEIYLISDMQKSGWGDAAAWGEGMRDSIRENKINVYMVDIAAKNRIDNVGIVSVKAVKESRGKISVLNIFSDVMNFSDEAVDNKLIKSYISEKESVKGFVSLKPRERVEKSFFTPINESGIVNGYVRLKGDSYAPDDMRYFSLKSYRTVRTLVVDGDPTTQVFKSETFYLNLGLNPLMESYSKIESHIVTFDEFNREQLINYDVVFLANVESVGVTKMRELRGFVKRGGGVIFALGDNVDPLKYNETFGDLLPLKLRDVYTKVKGRKDKPFEYISVKDNSHPVLMPFGGADSGDLSMAKFNRYFVLEPALKTTSNIILEFSNGNPCLIEKKYHEGRVLLFTSTADRDYNDLCTYPTYLPLMQQMTLYVANALGKEAYTELIIEDASEFSVEKSIENVTVADPEGNIFYEETKALKEIAKVKFEKTFFPGFYNVYEGKVTKDELADIKLIDTFAVNVDPDESDFTKVDEKMLKELFSENFNYIKKSGDMDDIDLRYLRGEEIWRKLLVFLLIALLLEAVISSTWRKQKKIKRAKWKEEGINF